MGGAAGRPGLNLAGAVTGPADEPSEAGPDAPAAGVVAAGALAGALTAGDVAALLAAARPGSANPTMASTASRAPAPISALRSRCGGRGGPGGAGGPGGGVDPGGGVPKPPNGWSPEKARVGDSG